MSLFVRALVFSFAIHFIVYVSLIYAPTIKRDSKVQQETINITYSQEPLKQRASKGISNPNSKNQIIGKVSQLKSTSKSRTYNLFEVKPDFTAVLGDKKVNTGSSDIFSDTYNTSPNVDNVDAEWGVGAGTFERAKDYLLMKKIYEHIDNALFFPSFFHRNNIEGVINARLVIDFEGKCDWKKIKFYGEQPYMKLFVLSVLKSACRQNFKPFLKQRLLTNVDLSFQFEITEPTNSQLIEKKKYIVGNALMFYRNSYKSIMEWEFGPFQGVFPVPAIYLNIPWIQENWDKIMYSKDPITEFKKEFGS